MKIVVAFAVAAAIALPAAGAQQPVKPSSTIMGVAIDSLHFRPLSGADVVVSGVVRPIVTDSMGVFRIDGLPAGNYQVGIYHPLLDSLGISLASPTFSLGADSTSVVRLAIPSAKTLVAQTCKSRFRSLGNSAIFGRLTDPDTFEPVPNAEVSIVWVQFDVSKESGIRQTPRLVRDSTDANGFFRLCGLPSELQARLQANYKGVMTADVPVETSPSDGDFILRPLYISRAAPGTVVGRASVSGKVTFAGGQPATGSHVEVVGSKAAAVTNERGEFSLSGAPSGTQMLLVRHLGWTPQEVPVELSSAKPQRVAVQLQKYVPVMDPVIVKARSETALESVGFTHRQRGGTGRYLNADQIAKRQGLYLSDILRTVPGLAVQMRDGQPEIVSAHSGGGVTQGCVTYFVDGMRFRSAGGGDANNFVDPREVVGIEVYQPSEVPAEFMDGGGSTCTTIVVWTKLRIR